MAFNMTKSMGMMALAVYLILAGISGLVVLPIPGAIMAVLALIAGILILIGR